METNPIHPVEPSDNDRRRFLKLASAALLAGAALPHHAYASNHPGGANLTYTGGIVLNHDLPAPAGDWILNVYLAVDSDGTGMGTLSDVLHPEVNSHLAVHQTVRNGNEMRFEGVVLD